MKLEEFIDRANSQPVVEKQRIIRVPGPELKKLLAGTRAVPVLDIISHPDQSEEVRIFRYKHILEQGVTSAEMTGWQLAHPNHKLPDDLLALLARVNGIHLWADTATGRSYFGVLPLNEWCDAATWDCAFLFAEPPQGHLVMSYHDNSDEFLILDTGTSSYFLIDGETGDKHPLGRTAEEFITLWWDHANVLDPRFETAG
jgi:hypothetical protein